MAAFFLLSAQAARAGYYPVTTLVDDTYAGTFRYAISRAATEAEDSIIDVQVAGTVFVVNSALPSINKASNSFSLVITGNSLTLDGSGLFVGEGLSFLQIGWVEISNLSIANFPSVGVDFAGVVTGGNISGLAAEGNGGSGLELDGASVVGLQIAQAEFVNNSRDGVALLRGTTGHVFSDCLLELNATNGFLIGRDVADIRIEATTIQDNSQDGVHLVDGASDIQIGPDNVIEGNEDGVSIEDVGSERIAVSGNQSISENSDSGVRILDAVVDITVADNAAISLNGVNGVYVGSNGANVVIARNVIADNEAGRGIWVRGPGDNFEISGNRISGHIAQAGIEASGIDGFALAGNWIDDNSRGVVIAGGSAIELGLAGWGNGVTANAQEGVFVAQAADLAVEALRSTNNGGMGLLIADLDSLAMSASFALVNGDNGIRLNNVAVAAFVDVESSGNAAAGLSLSNVADLSLSASTIADNGSHGVQLDGVIQNADLGPNNMIEFNGQVSGAGIYISGGAVGGVIRIFDGTIEGALAAQAYGVRVQTTLSDLEITGSDILGHVAGSGSSAGVFLESAQAIVVGPGNRISGNQAGLKSQAPSISGIISGNNSGSCTGAGFAANLGDAINVQGGNWTVEDNCIAANGGRGVYATLWEDGNVDPAGIDNDVLANITVRDNDFALNVAGGVLVEESYTQNIDELIAGGHGNNFVDMSATMPFGFSQKWRALVALVYSNGATFTPVATCDFNNPGNVTETTSLNGFCPSGASPNDYSTWPYIEYVRVLTDSAATVIVHEGQQVEVAFGEFAETIEFVWDGCTDGEDVEAAPAPFNQNDGPDPACPGGVKGRFLAAQKTIFPAPSVYFRTLDFSDTLDYFDITNDGVDTAHIEAAAQEIDQTNGPDTVFVSIRNLNNGDQIASYPLLETSAHSSIARSLAPVEINRSPPPPADPNLPDFQPDPLDGVIHCRNLDTIEVEFINSAAPGMPAATHTVVCLEEVASDIFFCTGPEGAEQTNQIIGAGPLKFCLNDRDENKVSAAVDAIPASQIRIAVERRVGGINDYDEFDALQTGAVETAVNSGSFYQAITQFVSDNDLPFNFSDQAVSCGPGDRLVVEYTDANYVADTSRHEGRCVLSPTPSSLTLKAHRYNAPGIAPIHRFSQNPLAAPADQFVELGASVTPNLWFYVEVEDPNRNYGSIVVNTISAVDVEDAANELDAIQRSLIVAESFDGGGERIDWIRINLTETSVNSGVFRGIVRTSSHFGANSNFNEPNEILEVAAGGRIRVSYVDGDDPGYTPAQAAALGLEEPCPVGFNNYDCRSQTLQVVDDGFANAVTFADRYGHSSSQLYLPETQELEPHSVRLLLPSANQDVTVAESVSLGLMTVESLQTFDGFLNIVGRETDVDSGLFLFPFFVNNNDEVNTANSAIEGVAGDVIYVRMPQGSGDLNPVNWAHDTAVLCYNSPSFMEVTNPSVGPEQIDRIRLDDELLIRVFDADQNAANTVRELITVTISSAIKQDLESVILRETTVDSGMFDAVVVFPGTGDAIPGDGRVHITDRDTITIRYVDNASKRETSPFCDDQDQSVKIYAGDSRDRLTQLIFIDDKGNRIEDLPVGEPIRLQVSDIKANLDTNRRDSVTAQVFLDPERRGRPDREGLTEIVRLVETGNRSAIYRGQAKEGPTFSGAAPSLADFGPLIGSWYSARYLDKLDDPFDDIVISAPILAQPLQVTVTTRPEFGSIGDAVMVEVQIWNPNPLGTLPAELLFYSFHGLSETKNSLRLRGRPVELPPGRPWRLPIGQVQARELVRMTWTAAVSPIAKGKLTAWGEVWAQDVLISQRGVAEFKVVEEPLFTRSTVFLNVFQDNNANGLQEFTEPPLAGVRIVAGDGFSVRTDARGQAHFANLEAGPDAFRIDMRSLPAGWQSTGRESQFVELLPGMLHSLSFGVRPATEAVTLEARATPWKEAVIETVVSSIPIAGSLDDKQLVVAEQTYPMIEARLSLQSPAPNALFTSRIASDGYLQFNVAHEGAGDIERWSLQLFEAGGSEPIKRFGGRGQPPPELALSAEAALALLRPGRDYEAVVQLQSDHGVADSGRLSFHVYIDPPKEDLGRASNFTKNEASLDPYTILALREAALLVLNYPESTILVEGFTDNRGGAELNKRLGQRRADMAKDYLAIVEGVDPNRITAVGRGAEKFICSNDTEEDRACNRRVEISVFGLPSQQARVFKPSVKAPDGSQVAVTQNNRFSTQGQVQGDRLNITVQFPSGATYFAAITVPETRVIWEPRAVVTPPEFAIPLTLVAPLGTTVTIADRVVYMDQPTKTVEVPLLQKAALRAQFYPPAGPSMSWVGLVKLVPTLRPPVALANLKPERFVVLELPGAEVPVRSGPWTVTGTSMPGARVSINGQSVQVDAAGRFAVPVQVGAGERFYMDVAATHPAGLDAQLQQSWPVENRHVLAVGVAQLSSEQKRRGDYGTGQRTSEWEHRGYGRFYVEGQLPGDVLLKARFRSEDRPLKTYLPDLLKYDGSAEDLIDPSRTYLVYGDDSTSVDEAPAEGPIMLLLAWNDQLLEIGTIELDERPSAIDSRTELSYGAHARLSSAPLAPSAPTRLDGFGTRPNSARAQDRFAATGGLVYYLRNADVQEGSERLWVEDEDSISGFRQTLRTLKYGEDYTIDYLSGRIWLINPVALAGPGATVVRDGALSSNNRWIVASYRYRPSALIDASGHGEMLRQDLGRWGEVGVLYREEEVETILQRRGRTWIEVNPNTDTTLEFEAGRRWGAVEEYAVSLDGGLTFAVTAQTQADPSNAFAAGGRTRVGRFELTANGRHLDQGYGGLRYSSAQTVDAGSLGVVYDVTDRAKIGWRGDITQIGDTADAQDRIFATHPVGPVELTYELRHELYQPPLGQHNRVDGGLRAVYPIPPNWTVYGEHQQEVFQSGILASDSLERRSTVGAGYAFSTTWSTFAEATEGNRERGGRIGGGYGNQRQRFMVSYGVMQNILGDYLSGVVGAGAQQQVGSRTTLSGAQEFRHGDRERGTATILGSQFLVLEGLTVGAEAERGRFIYGDEDEEIIRSAARGRVLGRIGEHRLEARGGWHLQERPGYDLMGFSTDDRWRTRFLKSAESMLRFRFARDVTRPGGDIAAEFQEYAAGMAYRPIQHNRIQLLSVVSWAKERLTPVLDPSRSLMVASIGSVDGSIRLAKQLEVGFKVAGKRSGVEFDGFKSEPIHTVLSAGRMAWIFFEPFDLLGEYRVWKQWETEQLLHGPLVELGVRMLPDAWQANVRFGMGYNFTTFRDELRPHDRFDAEGFRLRLMGLF